ncbi:MAG: SRPBCC domain-containing protein [Myxacorys chilensis ATA2-1-KO14]|jgi:uncharacterized protein YndB with AHSA1/START domain|nr:SRPBCC domain-containing protein [Myxacorys chilensis ATA2-1-KO14]
MSQDVVLNVFYPHPPEQVWKALTDRRALSAWMMDNDFEACLGHKFRFQGYSFSGQEIAIDCEVLEIEPPKHLVYSWKEQLTSEPSRVTWTLTPVEGGTQIQLRHRSRALAIIPAFGIPVLNRASRVKMSAQSSPLTATTRPLRTASYIADDSYRVSELLDRQIIWHYWLEQRLVEVLTRSQL